MSLRNSEDSYNRVRRWLTLDEITKQDLMEFKEVEKIEEKYWKAMDKLKEEKNINKREVMKVGLELAVEAAYQAYKSKEPAEIGGSQKKLGWP